MTIKPNYAKFSPDSFDSKEEYDLSHQAQKDQIKEMTRSWDSTPPEELCEELHFFTFTARYTDALDKKARFVLERFKYKARKLGLSLDPETIEMFDCIGLSPTKTFFMRRIEFQLTTSE